MALLKYEHFDLYGGDVFALLANGYTLEGQEPLLGFGSPGRTGPNAISMLADFPDPLADPPIEPYTGPQFLVYDVPGDFGVSTLGVGVAMYVSDSSLVDDPDGAGVYVNYSGGSSIRILPGEGNKINIYDDINVTPIASSAPGAFALDSWFYVEVKLVAAGVGASVEVRINGSTTAAVTATSLSFGNLTQVRLGYQSSFANLGIEFDDLVVWDTAGTANNNFMGNCKVVIAAPDADTLVADWTPETAGPLFEMVDEEAPDDSDFISADTVGDAEELEHTDPSLSGSLVKAVATQVRAQKAGAGAASIEIGVDSNGTDSVSSAIELADSWASYSHILNVDPSGSVSWTNARALAAKTRVEIDAIAAATDSEVSQQFKVLITSQDAGPGPGDGITFEGVTAAGFTITI